MNIGNKVTILFWL